jgi:alpha-tubulin suppressor-like RCC1 family protein
VTSNTSWTATKSASWVTITGGASGSGNGIVTYSVAENLNTTSRKSTITVNGNVFTINQSGAPPAVTISPASTTVPYHGAVESFTVSSNTTWSATTTDSWITVTSGQSGSLNGTVGFSVSVNPLAVQRSGAITVNGIAFGITQGGSPGGPFVATSGDDFFTLGPAFGDLLEDGLAGFDTVIFPPGIRPQDLELTDTLGPDFLVQVGEIGSLQLSNFERLQFADGAILSLETIGEVMSWGTYVDAARISPGAGRDSDLPSRVDISSQSEFGPPSLESVIAMDAGGGHALAVSAFGRVFAWGRNHRGQLGIGTTIDTTSPQQVDLGGALAGKRVIAVAAGEDFSLALTDEGRVYSWGSNQRGQLGNGTTTDSSVPVAVDASGALSGKTITKIAAGLGHAVALASDGKVITWGFNSNGQLGIGSAATQVLVPTAVESTGVLAGKSVTAIAAGYFHSLALGANGHIYAWGFNFIGQLGDGSTDDRSVPVEVARTGPLSDQTVSAIAAGGYHSLAATSAGNVVSWGDYIQFVTPGDGGELLPVAVPLAGARVAKLAAGLFYSVALTDDGRILSWGESRYGQLGIGQSGEDSFPVEAETRGWLAGRRVRDIAAGNRHTIALTDTVYLQPDIEVRSGGLLLLNGGPASVFPTTVVGQASESTTLGVMNQGRLQLDGFTVRLGGDHPEDFGFDDMLNGLGFRDLAEVAVRFQPRAAGLRRATLEITSNDPNESPFTIALNGDGVTAQAAANAVIGEAGLTEADADLDAQPFNDGVPNLLKYAFNMNLAGPDAGTLPPGTGASGLPSITTPDDAPLGTLRFEFLRRKGSGLVYTPKKSTTLDGPSWTPLTASPVVTSINDQWERVAYTEAPDPIPAPACFGRVEVSIP